MTLPPEIESYREEKRFFNSKVPDAIVKRWLERIDKYDLQYKGEKGAQMYLEKYGKKISEEKVVHFAVLAENLGYPEMGEGFWKKAFSLNSEGSSLKIKEKPAKRVRSATPDPITESDDRRLLRDWWHEVLRTHGKYSCYGIFLTLSSDENTIRYLTQYGKELNQISNKSCLIVTLGKTKSQRHGFDEGSWRKMVNEQTSEGYSITVARQFGIEYRQFPGLLLFENIRSTDFETVKLQGMTTEQIAIRMRLIFTIVENAIKTGKHPLDELRKQQNIELLQQKGQLVASRVINSIEKIIEALVISSMKG